VKQRRTDANTPPDGPKDVFTVHDLPYTLLSDEDKKVRKLYGVPNTLGLFPGRVTYIIDREGIVRHVFSSQLGAEKHVEEAIKALQFIS